MDRRPTALRTLAAAAALLGLTACGADGSLEEDPATEAPTGAADEPDDTDDDLDDTDTDTDATDDGTDDTDAAEDDADAGTDGDATATDQVLARNITWEPADIEVAAGTTVTWTNEDIVRHTVTSGPVGEPDGTFDLALDAQGDAVTFTFDEAGEFPFYCDLHRGMVGTVVVTG